MKPSLHHRMATGLDDYPAPVYYWRGGDDDDIGQLPLRPQDVFGSSNIAPHPVPCGRVIAMSAAEVAQAQKFRAIHQSHLMQMEDAQRRMAIAAADERRIAQLVAEKKKHAEEKRAFAERWGHYFDGNLAPTLAAAGLTAEHIAQLRVSMFGTPFPNQ